jgi:hypothetical protein
MQDSGVAGMVRSAAWLEHVCGTEVVSIGRSANAKACSMNEPEPQLIFNVGDTPSGWTTVRKFAQALERSGVKSVRERPVEIGEPGSPDSWVIA